MAAVQLGQPVVALVQTAVAGTVAMDLQGASSHRLVDPSLGMARSRLVLAVVLVPVLVLVGPRFDRVQRHPNQPYRLSVVAVEPDSVVVWAAVELVVATEPEATVGQAVAVGEPVSFRVLPAEVVVFVQAVAEPGG